MSWYAWTAVTSSKDKANRPIKSARYGDEVTPESLGLKNNQFMELVNAGAIRAEMPPPLPSGSTLSPTDYFRRQAAVASGDAPASVLKDTEVVHVPDLQNSPTLPGQQPLPEEPGSEGNGERIGD